MLILDQYWWFIIPGLLLGLYARVRLSAAYGRYSQVPTNTGLSGAEAAREILDGAGLRRNANQRSGRAFDGSLRSDQKHSSFPPRIFMVARLPRWVSLHETGHALQHQAAYAPLQIRMALVPVTQIASNAALWISMLGYFMGFAKLAMAGVVVFGVIFSSNSSRCRSSSTPAVAPSSV
jgi:Zn-dependent membrane protease YugP